MSQETEVLALLDDETAALALYTPLNALFAEYQKLRADIEQISGYVAGASDVMCYFLAGAQKERSVGHYTATELFAAGPAIRALDSYFWSRAMKLTDVLDLMPAEVRNEWTRQIRAHETPPFEPASVRATLQTMIASRAKFFADRVEGLFYNLSDRHATNSPEGFCKRMILSGMLTYFGSLCYDRCNLVHDLRCVIAKFSGRGEPPAMLTARAMEGIYRAGNFGVWYEFDGGAIRVRLYKVGTCHIEIHPDVAYRLNMVLAWRNPTAIPVRFRKVPARDKVDRPLHHGLAHFDVISSIGDGVFSPDGRRVFFTSPVPASVADFLCRHGGQQTENSWQFHYDFRSAFHEMERTGRMPKASSNG
ncbi:DUF4942 domain-containing protein [Sulfuricystis multivorans]|uniref:DUF4942 domain-containing protein n=1 Tax=Sulfuricystis multivorans TaxID=2211108 RepID=UPI000F84DA59|nr:DUF4942 domain-containing protein [Sulfuricystis multivorans]